MRGLVKIAFVGMMMVFLMAGGCAKETSQTIAEVNGLQLTQEQLDLKVGQAKTMFEMQGFQFDDEEGAEMLALLEREALNQLIMETVIRDEAKEQKIVVTAEEIQKYYDQIAEPYGKDAFKEMLKQQNMTEKQLKVEIELMLMQNQLFDKITAEVSVSDGELEEYYETHKDALIQYRASHILIRPDEETEDQEKAKAEAKVKAEALIEELNQGADFAELAKANSADGSAASGGDLGQFFSYRESPYVPEFTEGVVGLGVGEHSKEPVETFFGYHIIKLTEKKENLGDLREDIFARVERNKKAGLFDEYLSKAMEKAKIVNHLEQKEAKSGEQDQADEQNEAAQKGK